MLEVQPHAGGTSSWVSKSNPDAKGGNSCLRATPTLEVQTVAF